MSAWTSRIPRSYLEDPEWALMAKTSSNPIDTIRAPVVTRQTRRRLAWRHFKDVSVSGIDAALDSDAPILRRVLWAFMLCVTFSLMLAQCYDRISRFVGEPINVNVRITHNDSLVFPAVTICNKNIFNLTAARNLLIKYGKLKPEAPITDVNVEMLVGVQKMTPADVWATLAHSLDVFIAECTFNKGAKCKTHGNWTQVFTVMGPCYTYTLNEENVNTVGPSDNLFLLINESTPISRSEDGMRVLIHERTESPVLAARTHSMSAELGWDRDLKMELRKFEMLKTVKSPCIEDPSYLQSQCQLDCFQSTLTNYSKCRMPYMTGSLMDDMKNCSTSADYREAVQAVQTLLVSSGWSAANNCSCEQQCQQTSFLMYPEAVPSKKNQITLRIFYQDLVFEQITEERAYSMISLLCDIGGTLGLLMGASLLTVCELLEVAWSHVLSTYCRRRNDRNPPPLEPKPPARLRASQVPGNIIMCRV